MSKHPRPSPTRGYRQRTAPLRGLPAKLWVVSLPAFQEAAPGEGSGRGAPPSSAPQRAGRGRGREGGDTPRALGKRRDRRREGEGERDGDRSEAARSGARGGGGGGGEPGGGGRPGGSRRRSPGGPPSSRGGGGGGGRQEGRGCRLFPVSVPPVQPARLPRAVPRAAEPPSGLGPGRPPWSGASLRPAAPRRTLPSPADTGGSSRWCTGGTSAVSTLCP